MANVPSYFTSGPLPGGFTTERVGNAWHDAISDEPDRTALAVGEFEALRRAATAAGLVPLASSAEGLRDAALSRLGPTTEYLQ